MNSSLKNLLRKIVLEALNNASDGDTTSDRYRDGPTDSIAFDLFNFCSEVPEFLEEHGFELLQPTLKELVEEWKSAGKFEKTGPNYGSGE